VVIFRVKHAKLAEEDLELPPEWELKK